MKPGTPVKIVRNGHTVAHGTVYARTSDTQIAVRSLTVPTSIGLFASEDVKPVATQEEHR